ncbi:MAG: hypothetical protein R6V33_10315 [Pelovirga sp.]
MLPPTPLTCPLPTAVFARIRVYLLLLPLLAILTGCSAQAARTQELLATDFQHLDDQALLLHYYEVEDQIDLIEQRRTSPAVSLGFGLGSYGGRSSVGGGVGVSTPVGQPESGADLRAHRNRVRLELQRRDITP